MSFVGLLDFVGYSSSFEEAAVALATKRLNSPTDQVPFRLTSAPGPSGTDIYGDGTDWPISIPLPDSEDSSGYRQFDIGTAIMIRITKWHAAISISKTETVTEDSSGDSWTYTATASLSSDLSEKTQTVGGGPLPDESIFAQFEGLGNTILEQTCEFLQITGGGISGTFTPAVGAPIAFTATWDANNNNFTDFGFNGMEVFGLTSKTGVLGYVIRLSMANFTPTWNGARPVPSTIGFIIFTNWDTGLPADTQSAANASITIPAWDGSGNVSASSSLGFFDAGVGAGITRNSLTITGSIALTPAQSLSYAGIWNTSTGAPILNPKTQPLDAALLA